MGTCAEAEGRASHGKGITTFAGILVAFIMNVTATTQSSAVVYIMYVLPNLVKYIPYRDISTCQVALHQKVIFMALKICYNCETRN